MIDDALKAAVEKVIDAANENRDREPALKFREALNNLASLEGFDADQKRSRLTSSLEHVTSASGAGFVAIWLGAGVENGADPTPQTQHLFDCFIRFSSKVETEDENTTEDEIDDELSLGLELLGQGIVAHLSRDAQGLKTIQADTVVVEELERVEWYSPGPMWILELIRKVSGTLIVLHGEQLVGAKVEYRNISNCFHLFTLLQAALAETMPGARRVTSNNLAVAYGESLEESSDEAWWHYGQPVSGDPDMMTSVFGEQPPKEIGSIDGQQVILLWPPILQSRTWDTGFFGPNLQAAPPEVELLEMLSTEDIAAWRERIGLSNAQLATTDKPWWKFWSKR